MIGILVVSRYAAPPYPAAPDFPPSGGQNKTPRNTLFINGSAVSTGYCATELQGWQRRYKKWCRRRRTSPAGTVSQPIGKPFNGQAKGLLWLTWRSYAGPPQYYITPEGGALNPPVRRSRSQAEPLAPRAKGPAAPSTLTPVRACQPSGIPASTAQVPIPTAERPHLFHVKHF